MDRCSGSGPGSQAGRVEDAVVSGEILPFLPADSSLAAGHTQLRGQLPLCGGTDCIASGSDSGKKTECQVHSGTGPGEITSIIKQTNKKDLGPIDIARVYGGGASMLLVVLLGLALRTLGVFHSLMAEVLGCASTVILLEYSAHLSLSEAGTEPRISPVLITPCFSIPPTKISKRMVDGFVELVLLGHCLRNKG